MRGVLATAVIVGLAAGPAAGMASAEVKAGVGKRDASWHVGASAGQYASNGSFAGDHGIDPAMHTTRRASSYGLQSRLSVRALVVEGSNGERVALVKNDLYIPQDYLYRRTAQLLEAKPELGIGRENLTMAVSHNHSSPYYSSTAWGAWAFQDVFDARFFDYYSRRMAAAVEDAARSLVPVRVGASVRQFDKTHRHSFGPARADDGSPAGYPQSDADHDLTVVRFDDVSDPGDPKPLANVVNWSLHPEFLEGNDLISADYLGPLERMVDRESGAMTIWTQSSVGTAEPERSTYHSIHERLEFSHKDYAQAEYGARLMADSILATSRDVATGTPEDPGAFVPFGTDFPVMMEDAWYPGPFSHPYPGVSNCRTDKAFGFDPQVPIAGLPDCESSLGRVGKPPQDPGLSTDTFQRMGIPLPENYSAPSYTGLEEDVSVHLQAFRLGDILFPVCSCEQWKDQAENIKTRTDRVEGNEYLGYDWASRCTPNGDGSYGGGAEGYGNGTWNCPDPRGGVIERLSDQRYQRMKAQVSNPANGWNDLENAATAESEPTDVRKIKGNYTHDDDARSAQLGYRLTVPISMANDYNGYIASYREYQRGDHYRKALTGWGPHSSDYMATRMVTLGRRMQDPSHPLPADQEQEQALLGAKVAADLAKNDRVAELLGRIGSTSTAAYEAGLPDDGGTPGPVEEPRDIQRFQTAFFTWTGGSNFTDDPDVEVQRKVDGEWRAYADQSGEIPVTVEYPQAGDAPAYLSGGHEWRWTAHFEAFAADFDTGRGRATAPGEYRFAIRGSRREGGKPVPYTLTSRTFEITPWEGVTVEDFKLEDGRPSFRVGPRSRHTAFEIEAEIGPIDYPDSYASPTRFIREQRTALRDPDAPKDPSRFEWFCFTCTFRPWADTGRVAEATIAIQRPSGRVEQVSATESGDRLVAPGALAPNETATVCPGAVRDTHGNFNGERSATLGDGPGGAPRSDPCAAPGGSDGQRSVGDAPAGGQTGGGAETPAAGFVPEVVFGPLGQARSRGAARRRTAGRCRAKGRRPEPRRRARTHGQRAKAGRRRGSRACR